MRRNPFLVYRRPAMHNDGASSGTAQGHMDMIGLGMISSTTGLQMRVGTSSSASWSTSSRWEGRHWLHEHPRTARPWDVPEVNELAAGCRVTVLQAHPCQYGLTAPVHGMKGVDAPAKNPTGFVANSSFIADQLNLKCAGDHAHAWLTKGRAAKAALYPRKLCGATCTGLNNQQQHDEVAGMHGLHLADGDEFLLGTRWSEQPGRPTRQSNDRVWPDG